MKDQLKVEELSQALEEEKDDKIAKLEAELKAAKNYASHTQEAANLLAGLIDAGELKVNEDNTVSVNRGPNIIMNEEEAS